MGFFDSIKKTVDGIGLSVAKIDKLDVSALEKALASDKTLSITRLSDKFAIINVEPTPSLPAKWYICAEVDGSNMMLRSGFGADAGRFLVNGGYPLAKSGNMYVWKQKITGEVTETLKDLKSAFSYLKDTVLEEFAPSANSFSENMFASRPFILNHLRELLAAHKYFDKVDDEGDVRLFKPATDDFKHELSVWLLLKDDRVTIDSCTRKTKLSGDLAAAAKKAQAKFPDWIIDLNSKGDDIRVKRRYESGFFPVAEVEKRFVWYLNAALDEMLPIWNYIFSELGMRAKASEMFDGDYFRNDLAKRHDYNLTDNGGDVKLVSNGREGFRMKRFVWVYIRPLYIEIDGGILDFKKNCTSGLDCQKIVDQYNKTANGFVAKESDGSVRIKRRFKIEDFGEKDFNKKALNAVSAALPDLYDELVKLAKMAGMNYDYYVPTVADVKNELKDKLTMLDVKASTDKVHASGFSRNTSDGYLLLECCADVVISESSALIRVYYNMPTNMDRTFSNTSDERTSISKTVANRVGNGFSAWYDGSHIGAERKLEYTSLSTKEDLYSILVIAYNELVDYRQAACDIRLKSINEQIEAEAERRRREAEERRREEERRRQEEEERRRREKEAAERERRNTLASGFNYTLRPGGTVRALQEGFTEDYPYLRIGVFMVKTGQAADRYGDTIKSYDRNTTFGEIRSFKGECRVRIEGGSTPKSLEAEFRRISGLVIKICYNDENDHRYYVANDSAEYTTCIYDLNNRFREAGYYKADIS